MTSFDDLLSQVPVAQIADKLGVDQDPAADAESQTPKDLAQKKDEKEQEER